MPTATMLNRRAVSKAGDAGLMLANEFAKRADIDRGASAAVLIRTRSQ